MERGQSERSKHPSADAVSYENEPTLLQVLDRLKTTGALLSAIIDDELSASADRDMLERLYAAKGDVTCAIEEAQKRISQTLFNVSKFDE